MPKPNSTLRFEFGHGPALRSPSAKEEIPGLGQGSAPHPESEPSLRGLYKEGRKCDIFYLARYPRFLAAPTEIPISWAISFHDNPRALKSMT
jgi:hypothetical protein